MSVAKRVSTAVCLVLPALMAMTSDAGPQPPATNILYGFINYNRTLTVAAPGPTYEVLGDLVIQPGVTLTVEPGVTLRVAANSDTLKGGNPNQTEITVYGSIVAQGTMADSVRFESSDYSANSWGGISLPSGTATLDYVVMVGPQTALSVGTGGPSYFRHSSVRACGSGIYAATSGTVFVQASVLTGTYPTTSNGSGLYGFGVTTQPPDSNNVEPTAVSWFDYGVYNAPAQNVVATRCRIGFTSCQLATYCTAVYNDIGFTACRVMNSIAVGNSAGAQCCYYIDYSDLWNNYSNLGGYQCNGVGPYVAFFDPFFVNPTQGDFRLAANSVFKNFSSTGWEIGAYGPGNTPPVKSRNTSWGALKSLYR